MEGRCCHASCKGAERDTEPLDILLFETTKEEFKVEMNGTNEGWR
jgi:hypothetical protein